MKAIACRTGVPLLVALAALAGPGAGPAAGQNVKLTAEVGARTFADELATQERAKFEEYRQIRSGFFLEGLRLQYLPGSGASQFEFGAQRAGQRDQGYWLQGSRPGLFDVRIGWDQIPHTYSTTARMIGGEPAFTLPTPRPDTATWNATAALLDPVRTRWNAGQVSLSLRPTVTLESMAEYTRIGKDGSRPIGMAFGSPGSNYREIFEPINQTTHDLKLSQSFARERYQLQVSYNLSVFQNTHSSVVADNPLVATDGTTTGSSRGRLALAPDNTAHTFTFVGGLNLPARTRISTLISYGLQKQNAEIIPYTVNTAITSPEFANLPAGVDADLRTTLANITASSRPIRNMTITARYRLFDQEDKTDEFVLPIRVSSDRSLQPTTQVAREHFPFTRHNAGVDLGWRAAPVVSLKVGYAWERWDRNEHVRNVARSTESTPRVTLDLTPTDWLLLRGSYAHSERRADAYRQIHAVQLPEFFRLDQNDRNRDRADFLLQLTPIEQLTASGTLALGRNRYREPEEVYDADGVRIDPQTAYGVQDDDVTAIGGDLAWTPFPRLNLFASYVHEIFDLKQLNRMRESSALNNTSFDWLGKTREKIQTLSLGLNAVIIPGKLDGGFAYDWSEGSTFMRTSNPTTPTGGTASQITSATAVDLPAITHMLNPLRAYLSYRFVQDWAVTAGFDYEKFEENDFRADGLNPATGADIMLGNDLRNYTTSYFSVTVSYRPGSMLLRRPVL